MISDVSDVSSSDPTAAVHQTIVEKYWHNIKRKSKQGHIRNQIVVQGYETIWN